MGGGTSKENDDAEDEVQYYNFVRKKNQKDKDKHEFISNQEGTAYKKLMKTDSNDQPRLSQSRST